MRDPVIPTLFAGLLAATLAVPAAGSVRDDCLEIAAEEEVPAEDLEDFLAECIAMLEGGAPEGEAMDGEGESGD
jgi:hypothetical protein